MPRTPVKKPISASTPTHRWQWLIALCLIAGVIGLSAYAVIQHGSDRRPEQQSQDGKAAELLPVAQVRIGRERYFLDKAGIRVPSSAVGDAVAKGLIEIQGVESPPRGKAGERWGAPVVEMAAQLADFIQADRERLAIAAIEVDEGPVQAELRLRTKGGSRVLWECRPEDARKKTISAEEKLQRLRDYVAAEGSLDAPVAAGPYLHDVRFASEHIRKPLPK